MLLRNVHCALLCVSVRPLTPVSLPSPDVDVEGDDMAGSGVAVCVGGVQVWDHELTHDHSSIHHATDFGHILER